MWPSSKKNPIYTSSLHHANETKGTPSSGDWTQQFEHGKGVSGGVQATRVRRWIELGQMVRDQNSGRHVACTCPLPSAVEAVAC